MLALGASRDPLFCLSVEHLAVWAGPSLGEGGRRHGLTCKRLQGAIWIGCFVREREGSRVRERVKGGMEGQIEP